MATINHPDLTIQEEIKMLTKQRKEIFKQITELHKQADSLGKTIDDLYLHESIFDKDYLTPEF